MTASDELKAGAEREVVDLMAALEKSVADAKQERWKREVAEVLAGWQKVWEALGTPGELGEVVSVACVAEVERRAEAHRFVVGEVNRFRGVLEGLPCVYDLNARHKTDTECVAAQPDDPNVEAWCPACRAKREAGVL